MNRITELVREYLTIMGMYDGGRKYTWDHAYRDMRKVTEKMYEVSKRARTPENRVIARAVYEEMKDEEKRLYVMAFNYKEAKKET